MTIAAPRQIQTLLERTTRARAEQRVQRERQRRLERAVRAFVRGR